MPLPGGLHGQDIVCVGFADWDTELWTNQHHLMSRLAEPLGGTLSVRTGVFLGGPARDDRAP